MNRVVIYPILITTFLVFALFNANRHLLSAPGDIIDSWIISLGLTGAIWVVLRLVLRSWRRAALPTCLLVIMCLEYGHFREACEWNPLALWLGGFGILCILTAIIKRTPTRIFNIISICLTLVVLVPFVGFILSSPTVIRAGNPEVIGTSNAPDIYYIITEEYSRRDVLLEECNFDNSEFINYLEEKEFHVEEDSYANYPTTRLSLASSLNMSYLGNKLSLREGNNLIQHNEVFGQLKSRGYILVNIGSMYGPTLSFEIVDINHSHKTHSDFSWLSYELSVFYREETKAFFHYRITMNQFEELRRIPRIPEPTFTLAHVYATHAPFVFNPDGSYRNSVGPATKEIFVEQVQALNKMLTETINIILERGNAVIIIQGDTGQQPWELYGYQEAHNNTYTGIGKESPYLVWARLGILNAIFSDYNEESGSPVNTFRILFNHYFDTNYEVLPNRYFWTINPSPPYEIQEVTEYLNKYIEQK